MTHFNPARTAQSEVAGGRNTRPVWRERRIDALAAGAAICAAPLSVAVTESFLVVALAARLVYAARYRVVIHPPRVFWWWVVWAGLCAAFCCLVALLWDLVQQYRHASCRDDRFLCRAALMGTTGFLITGMTDYTYGHSLGLILFGFVVLSPLIGQRGWPHGVAMGVKKCVKGPKTAQNTV